ncbi:MAG: porin [Luteolibacter sp.]
MRLASEQARHSPQKQKNPYLQEFQLEGHFQYQAAYLDGSDLDGSDFNETYDEYRRFRLGARGKFLQYFGFKFQANLVDDSRNVSGGGDLEWGKEGIDEAHLSFDLGKAIGETAFDSLTLTYGRQKFLLGQEAHSSSTKLLTVERSAIANKVYDSARPTGLSVDATKGDWRFNTSIYSSTTDGEDNEAFSGWQDSVIYYANAGYKISDELSLGADFVYNAADAVSEDSVLPYRWATSLYAEYDAGPWGVIGDLILGDNGGSEMTGNADCEGMFGGVVVMPYYWILENKLQLVGQYQYQGASEAEGVRVNNRYGRAGGITNINSGRGDSHHSLYGGLNYYLCGNNLKIQGGIEYQTMDTPDGDFDTLTYQIALSTYF